MIENYVELKNSQDLQEITKELYESISTKDFFHHEGTTFIHINDKYYARNGDERESIDLFCKIFKFYTYYSATSVVRKHPKAVKFVFCCLNEVKIEDLENPSLQRLKRYNEKPYFSPKGFIVNYQIVS